MNTKDIFKIYENNKSLVDNINLNLNDENILSNCTKLLLDEKLSKSLIEFKNNLLENNNGIILLKTYLSLYFTDDKGNLPGYIDLSSIFPCNSDLFFLLVAILRIDKVKELYKDNSISSEVLYDTLADIKIWSTNHLDKTGKLGLSELHWLYYHLSMKLFKIGRLQFMKVPFKGDVKLFKQQSTGFPLILSYGDIKYDFLGNKTVENEEFVSTYIESDITITANPVREGKCLNKPLTINKCDYSLEIDKGTMLLDIHITQGENLNIKECIESMKKAVVFFYKHFNGWAVKGFTCTSWLLNQNYKYILDENSNIRKFSSMFYPYPEISTDNQMYIRVFNGERDLSKLKDIENPTSLQRSIIKGLEDGLTFEDASMLFPCYDMKKLLRFML